jgi:diacylglycerol O-acyltransferase
MTRRRMPVEDTFWLGLDRPENLMVVTSLMWTAEEVDPDRLRAVVRERLLTPFPVFGRRPEMRGGLLRRGTWVDDPDFDLDRHLVVRPMPDPGDRAALRRFVGEQRSTPLDPAHPLWRIHLLQGYEGGSAVVTRFHHSMADGIRSTQVMLGMLDPLGERSPGLAARVGRSGPVHPARSTGAPVASMLNTALSVVKIGLWENPRTALEGRPGLAKNVAWSEPVPLEEVKAIAAGTGTTVNDVCTTLVSGAMARYLDRVGGPHQPAPGDDDVAWMVPVNLEPPGREPPAELGNHFALVLVLLPHGRKAFADRLPEVHRRMSRIRNSWEPALTFGLSRAIALAPARIGSAGTGFLASKAVGGLTDVPGPRTQMALAGAPVTGVVGWAPTSARQALTVTIFSYAGGVTFGFGTDPAVVPDVDALVTALDEELAEARVLIGAGSPRAARSSARSAGSR